MFCLTLLVGLYSCIGAGLVIAPYEPACRQAGKPPGRHGREVKLTKRYRKQSPVLPVDIAACSKPASSRDKHFGLQR